jgi:hypothetical protein
MTRTFNKSIIYPAIICGSVLIWHLAWLIGFGSPMGLLDWLRFHSPDESGSWFHQYALFYFVLFPLVIFAMAMVFVWNGRAFRREYPSTFHTVILAALTPGVFVAVMALLSTMFL